MSSIVSPDCRDQNHQKCPGDAWDEAHDHGTKCQCSCHAGHITTYTAPVVTDLGEDNEAWIVTGASSTDEVLGAIARWQIECVGFQDAMESVIPHLLGARTVFRMDWAWVPTNQEHPDDEANLVSGDDVPAGVATFEGTQVIL